ncbi:unnamed protein product [Gongylonema pulchrum]|uniref:Uncharacterized protein n=1 Tax=Gongylonema pulchrum TaxID=637853 RepID=A0A3P6RLV9_9BILA|nr:unnamed protein product [Gongylonema pulchrum]
MCPTASTPFISAVSLQPMQCTPNVDGACPGNFFCWFSTRTATINTYYCCRSPDTANVGFCPPELVPVSGDDGVQYRYCSPSAALNDTSRGCGTNRHCQYSSNLERYICCGHRSEARLPSISPFLKDLFAKLGFFNIKVK